MRQYTALDRFLMQADRGLRTVLGSPSGTARPSPAAALPEPPLSDAERDLAGRLMRINHAGEVAAQALYHGQALTAKLPQVRARMDTAAREENDHLTWCEQRLHELGGRTSVFSPLWYLGSLAIGAFAGAVGDRWSLGFLAETEHQVVAHLDGHLHRLPPADDKSRAIVSQMQEDEGRHARVALRAGGVPLPGPVRGLMRLTAGVMTGTAYWL